MTKLYIAAVFQPSREKTADFSYFKQLWRIAKQANDKYFCVKRQVAFEKKKNLGHYNKYNGNDLRT